MARVGILNFGYIKRSGIENFADNVLRQIDKLDNVNSYIVFVNKYAENYYISGDRISKAVIGTMAQNQVLKTLWLLFFYPFISLFRQIDVTVVFSGNNNFTMSPFTKNIIYIHDLGELYVKDKYDWKRMLYRKYIAVPINRMMGDFFIAVSNTTKKAILEKLKIDEKKIRVIYNGIDDNIRPGDKSAAKQKIYEKHRIDRSKKLVLTVGRIDPVGKNLLNLVHAIDVLRKKHPESACHVLLVGESNFPNAHLVSEEIQNRNLRDYFTLTGHVSAAELNDYFNGSDFLVFPSVHEGFGLPILEAMKCGLPVVCSDISVFHEVGDDAAIYFDPESPDDIAGKLLSIMNDDQLGSRMVARGGDILKKFSWENSARELLQVISSL